MAKGAPKGNQYAKRARVWTQAIEHALEMRSNADKVKALREIANVLLDKALDGDMQALKELGDRLEGKPNQSVDLQADGKIEITWKE